MSISSETLLDTKLVSQTPEMLSRWELIDKHDGQGALWIPRQREIKTGKITTAKFMPLPGSQMMFLECPIYECLYEGTRGPGKTVSLIMDFAKECGKGWGSAWRGVLFRREYKDLDEIVRQLEAMLSEVFPGFRFLKSKADYSAQWPDGETLLLRQIENENDYSSYHGHQYPWIGWDELSQWDDLVPFKLMFSCSRPTKQGIPLRIRASTNPSGPSHNAIKRRFRLPEWRGRIITDEKTGLKRVAIHGSLAENFILLHSDPQYAQKLIESASNPAQAAAWIYGRWDITSGGMFDDLWDPNLHIIPDFPIQRVPHGWSITRAYDHGQSRPFSVGWFLESDGTPMQIGNELIGRIRGDVILWREWYGRLSEDEPNVGLRISSSRIAEGIRDREADWGILGRVTPGPADSEIYNRSVDRDGKSPADDMEDRGIFWERADKSPGSRRRGWEMMRDRMAGAKPNLDGSRENAGFYVTENCRWFIELVPSLPSDIPDTAEDHIADMVRYRLSWEVPGMWRVNF